MDFILLLVLVPWAAFLALAIATQAGVWAVQRAFPPQGEMIEVDGATLHVVGHSSGLRASTSLLWSIHT